MATQGSGSVPIQSATAEGPSGPEATVRPSSRLNWVIHILNELPIVVGSVLMLGIAASVFAQVIARYVFNSGLAWSDEISRFMMMWGTFLGAAALIRLNEHITVDVFMSMMPRKIQTATGILTQLISSYIAYILITQGIGQIGKQWIQLSPALQWSLGAVYLVLPVAGLYMLAYSLANLAALVMGKQLIGSTSDKPLEL